MTRSLTFASFLAPNVRPVYEFIARAVGARLGCETRLITGSSFNQFQAGEIDLAFLCSPPYLRLASLGLVEAIVAPVLQGTRYRGRTIYFSDVVVLKDSPARSFNDLRGCRFSFNDVDSYSGYIAPLVHLAQLDETPAFFGSWIEAGSHEASIRLILSGKVDASAIDSQVLAIEALRPEVKASLRTIAVLGPAPIQPLVIASRLPDTLKDAVREILLGLNTDPTARAALVGAFVERFAPVNEATYEPVRANLARLETRAGVGVRKSAALGAC
jgi:phosphonate transport system substrate-binding protein